MAEMGGGDGGRRSREKRNFSVTCGLLSQYLKEKGSLGDLSLGIAAAARPSPPEGNSETLRTMNLLPGVEAVAVATAGVHSPEKDAAADRKNPMDLFPQRFGFVSSSVAAAVLEDTQKKADVREQQAAPQMTIFYGGKVIVFDNFPAEKAKELMMMAGRGNPSPSPSNPTVEQQPRPVVVAPPPPPPSTQHTTAAAAAVTKPVMAPPAVSGGGAAQDRSPKPPTPASSDLPIARRVSLNRFLEKRKDRITSKAPYQAHGNNNSSPESFAGKPESSSTPAKSEESRHWLGAGKPESSSTPTPAKPESSSTPAKSEDSRRWLGAGKPESSSTPTPAKPEESRHWLGLAPVSSKPDVGSQR